MSFPRYPKYKPSGVEWLGEVPEHWENWKLTHAFPTIGSGTTPKSDNQSYYEEGEIYWLNTGDLNDGELIACEKKVTPLAISEHSSLKVYPPDSLVIAMYGATIGKLAIIKFHSTVNQACCVFSGNSAIQINFMFYWFMGLRARIVSLATGGGQPNISQEILRSLRMASPSIAEQSIIANFLDQETAKIDALVAEQQRLIELLKEKRQAVISHAVTKGLDPTVPMKPSGIEWLGDIPAHWVVSKMKWIAKMESGHTPDKKIPEYWENGDIPWVSLNDTGFLKDHDYISETAYYITQKGIENSSAHLLPPRVVVFSRDATIGRCAITTRPMAVSQHFIAWVCGEFMIPEYLLLRLRSMTHELDRLTTGATLKTIGMPEVRTLVTPVPP